VAYKVIGLCRGEFPAWSCLVLQAIYKRWCKQWSVKRASRENIWRW